MARHRWFRSLSAGAVAVSLLVAAGCGSTSASSDAAPATTSQATDVAAPGEPSARAAREGQATVIDVRTPDEYAAGHIEGARLVDIQGEAFDSEVAALDASTTYVVYCRSGNRSAAAAERMRAAGLTVLDGGALDDMEAAGWPVTP